MVVVVLQYSRNNSTSISISNSSNSSNMMARCRPISRTIILFITLSAVVDGHVNISSESNRNFFTTVLDLWKPCKRKEDIPNGNLSPTLSSSNYYRNLEEFVLGELHRQNSKLSSSSHSRIWSPAWHLAASSNSPRGGGSVTVSVQKKPVSSQNQKYRNSALPAATLTQSFWTLPSNLHLQSYFHPQEKSYLSSPNTEEDHGNATPTLASTTDVTVPSSPSNHKQYAKNLKNRNNLNISRKVTHAAFGLFFATLNQLVPRATFLPCMTFVTSFVLVIEMLRYKKGFGWINDVMHFFLGSSLRKHEMEGQLFTGSFYYFLGVTLTSYLFPTPCATLGIVQLALADPAASYFGRLTKDISWSRIHKGFYGMGRNKGMLGFLMGAIFCVPFNYHILSLAQHGSMTSNIFASATSSAKLIGLISLILGLAGAFADLCVPSPALIIPVGPKPRFHVDDNLIVPIFAGYACTQVFRTIGWTNVNLTPWLFL